MELRRVALIAAGIASFLTPFIGSATNVALPSIGKEFGADAILLGWIATSYILVAGILSVPFGRFADIKGRKKVFSLGLAIFSIGSFLSAISSSAETLILFRVVQGVGGAMIFATSIAILTSVFPPSERGKAIGINVGTVYTGLSLGPVLGGYLTHNFGWRSVFLFNVPFGIAGLVIVSLKLRREWADARGERFDLKGSLIYALMLFFIIYGLTELEISFLILGITLLMIFVVYESKSAYPVFDVGLFRKNLTFSLSSLAALLNYAATFAVGFLLSLYLQYIKGLDPHHAGLVLAAQPVIMALLAPFAGWLSDKVEPRVVASAGMAVTTLSLVIFSGISTDTPVTLIIANLAILGVGLALFSSPNTNAIMSSVEKRFFGIASATVATMRLVGQLFSMALVMLVFSLLIGRVEISPQYYPLLVRSIESSFNMFSVLCFVGIFASIWRGKVR